MRFGWSELSKYFKDKIWNKYKFKSKNNFKFKWATHACFVSLRVSTVIKLKRRLKLKPTRLDDH